MAIRVALNHRTHYRYDRAVVLFPHTLRLRPAPHCRTPVTAYSVRVRPEEHFINWQQDPFGNYVARLVFQKPAHELYVEVDLVAELSTINPFDFFLEPQVEQTPWNYASVLAKDLAPFLHCDGHGPLFEEYLRGIDRTPRRTTDFLVDLNQKLSRDLKYLIRLEPGVQSCEQTLAQGSGSCRDFAWLQVQLLRYMGFAARFVSGYLIQLRADMKSLDGPSGPEADFTDLHAWTEVYLPGAGWVGLDATSGLFAGEGHIPLACTPEPPSAAAILGSFDDGRTGEADAVRDEFSFQMSVKRIHEDPRVTLPYSDGQWRAIDALGRRVDADLGSMDVRLTMGGEPTFVSIDDFDSPQWTVAAHGPQKRERAGELVRRLRDRFAPGGLLHFGQGKWYPGESLPRWALSVYWRKDGVALWEDPRLYADERFPAGHGEAEARRFVVGLADVLGVDGRYAIPGYEDAWYYMWKERRLPVNVDPFDSRLENEEDRVRLAKIFEQGLAKVVGYALPLERVHEEGAKWASGPWFFRPERMYLLPGDSPMGYRLPLDSLPWYVAGEGGGLIAQDPMADRGPLHDPRQRLAMFREGRAEVRAEQVVPGSPERRRRAGLPPGRGVGSGAAAGAGVGVPAKFESADWIVRTALCVEPRGGVVHVFLPPLRVLEDFVDLVAAIELAAGRTGVAVVVEGYQPPPDHRLEHLKVSPDPGVIEVNVHPSGSWPQLCEVTTGLYEDARQSRLGTEKFLLDGRHTGTGGGNHIVIGGPSPDDSPLLRRPDLLASLALYWNNHPSLSYLFSTLFIGPTSQSPRVDEARHEGLYELGLAVEQAAQNARRFGSTPPWLVDRLFRHIFIDVTGNTHRAELCIDKLYNPDSATGRLGLLELRGFEMPPHARMSLAQQLLLRALVAWFWKQPYTEAPVHWGTQLQDRWMLPHFVMEDFSDVLQDLQTAGYAMDRAWFAPHEEFRFPKYGEAVYRSVRMELRCALEPWYTLGEEASGSGTARYVDSSLERVQILVQGMVDPRHVVLCNGRRVPLHPTGTQGEFVAGVRYRAWQPPSCLHPTIGVHAPLVFDLYDRWSRRSIGGCTYHVAHPGGRGYEDFPVNANSAEARRQSRFFPFGHTPAGFEPAAEEPNPLYPMTLDLRR